MLRLKIPAGDAIKLIFTIPHKACQRGVERYWKFNSDGSVCGQSVLWLYCWAKTGQNSPEAKKVAVDVFDQLMETPFDEINSEEFHEYARKHRYAVGNIDADLDRMLVNKNKIA